MSQAPSEWLTRRRLDNALFTASEDRQGEYRVLAAPIGLANDRQ